MVRPLSQRSRAFLNARNLRSSASVLGLCALLALGSALARPVAVSGVVLHPVIETKVLSSGREGLPVWFLARLNVAVQNGDELLTLSYGSRTLKYSASVGWQASGFVLPPGLPLPELYSGSLHVSLDVLRALNVPIEADAPDVLDFSGAPAAPVQASTPPAATPRPASVTPTPVQPPAQKPPAAQMPTAPVKAPPIAAPTQPQQPSNPPSTNSTTSLPPGAPSLGTVRSSRTLDRNMEHQRVVLEFSAPVTYIVGGDKTGVNIGLPGTASTPSSQKLESGDTLSIAASSTVTGSSVRLGTGSGGVSTIFTLQNPFRVVIDTVTNINPKVPPPPDPAKLPPGLTEKVVGKLHLLSFDPALYAPQVVSAPYGHALPVATLVAQAGGVAGMNGGYFDPASSLPVDLVEQGGLMRAPSLERRATLGLGADGAAIYGYPRPRYVVSGSWGDLTVNTVTARANPNLLTLFVGDGLTATGGAGVTTLSLSGPLGMGGTVTRVQTVSFVPAAGELTLSFSPQRFSQLPTTPGAALSLSLNWRVPGWDNVLQALSAGPLLVQNGRYALDPVREGFDTTASIWRPTRQVAYGTFGGQPTLCYLEYGTPEDFARALAAAGVSDAVRMDSGSSATLYYATGFLNTVWSRPVVNAIVMVPRTGQAVKTTTGK